ncbi:MAG: T9SS type A sorting domain-containing protein [Bacteroidia bacterium]|nr:T9SS type A sorting domain-containing protein [Bacteroidia bacterium]
MRKTLTVCALLFFILRLSSQSASDAAVQLEASVQNSPAQIILTWVNNSTTSQYTVFRKLKTDLFWGPAVATLAGSVNQYTDNTVNVGVSYEYRVVRTGTGYNGYGYINAGIEIPETAWRGKVILLVDSSFIVSLSSEIQRLVADMEGDGWQVIRHDVLRTGSVTHVKDLILTDYYFDTIVPKAVFILGHIPVPYSGNINPDGHSDHLGAWPADCYYADMDGTWTDNFVTSTTASPARTQNIPGDGKFDQSIAPTELELQVGRVDFNDMPAFSFSEQQLLKNYLDKDHDYRKKIFSPLKQGVIDDNFGYFGSEAFAASGYKNFAPLLGSNNISSSDYFTAMSSASYQWSYGCGGGTYVSANGVGATSNFASSNLDGVFTLLFGSYFGDWDSQNNFLKAPLAQGRMLTSVWSGRPHYQFHHMALGENIGYSVLLTQNNAGGLYFGSPTGITGLWVHNALMGDPTLRNDVVAPVANVIATKAGHNCHISWSASTETNIVGYNIYRKTDTSEIYTKINSAPVSGTTYTDLCLFHIGVYTYMVRTLKLEQTPSGTYYNLSEGIADTAYNSIGLDVQAAFTYTFAGSNMLVTNTSSNAGIYFWDLGSGITTTLTSPLITYSTTGVYDVTLIASNGCRSDTITEQVVYGELGFDELSVESSLLLYPNPTSGTLKMSGLRESKAITVYNSMGQEVLRFDTVADEEQLDVRRLKSGLYFVRIGRENKLRKVLKE